MSLVRSPVRSSVSPLAISLLGGGALALGARVDAELEELIEAGGTVSQIEVQDLTSMRAATDGSGSAVSVGDSVGYIVDSSQLGGKTVAAYAAANGISDITTIPGNHWSAPSDTARPILLDTFSDPNDSALTDNGGRGEELVPLSGWTAGAGWTDNGDGTFDAAIASGFADIDVPLTLEVGVEYECSFTITNHSAGGVGGYLGQNGSSDIAIGSALNGNGTRSEKVRFVSTSFDGITLRANNGFTGTVSNISVRKVLSAFDERGPELVDYSGATLSAESSVVDGVITNVGDASVNVDTLTTSVVAGETYEVEVTDVTEIVAGSGSFQLRMKTSAGDFSDTVINNSASVGKYLWTPSGSGNLELRWFDVGGDATISCRISVKRVLYPNLVTNGTFDTDSDWTKGTGWSIGSGVATGATAATLYQDNVATASKWYRFAFYVSSYTSGTITPNLGGASGASVTSAGWNVQYIRANGSRANLLGSSFVGLIDNVIVQEVPSSISRRYFLRFDGIDDQLTLTDSFGSDMTVVMGMKTSDGQGMLLNGDSSSKYLGTFFDGSSSTALEENAGSPVYRKNGAVVTPADRDALHSELSGDTWQVLSAVGADLSTWTEATLAYFNASNAWNTAYDITYLAIFPSDADTLALNEQLAAQVSGVTLP